MTKLTKKYKTDLAKALRCAQSGKAYHWPTIAAILADEINRLKKELAAYSEQGNAPDAGWPCHFSMHNEMCHHAGCMERNREGR